MATAPLYRLRLQRFSVRAFRNLTQVDLEPAPGLNVLFGDNGQGKSSVLEAVYLLATTRSFRAPSLDAAIQHGAPSASVRGRFVDQSTAQGVPDGPAREQLVAIQGRRRAARLDGNEPPSLAHYATRSPVVVFHPGDVSLSTGPAATRRTLLDRLALFVDVASLAHRTSYARAMRARQDLLRRGHPAPAELDAYESLCAIHGAALTVARQLAADALAPAVRSAFEQIAAPDLALDLRYRQGGAAMEAEARDELARRRAHDARRLSATFGPHRDDLELHVAGHPARLVASQGQHRALALALKLAETACIAALRGVEPIMLLDDVSSELDADRTAALLLLLGRRAGQIFLTTTRRELLRLPGASGLEHEVRAGGISGPPTRT